MTSQEVYQPLELQAPDEKQLSPHCFHPIFQRRVRRDLPDEPRCHGPTFAERCAHHHSLVAADLFKIVGISAGPDDHRIAMWVSVSRVRPGPEATNPCGRHLVDYGLLVQCHSGILAQVLLEHGIRASRLIHIGTGGLLGLNSIAARFPDGW